VKQWGGDKRGGRGGEEFEKGRGDGKAGGRGGGWVGAEGGGVPGPGLQDLT